MVRVLVGVALALGAFSTGLAADKGGYKADEHGNYIVGEWRIQVTKDDFTGDTSCAIASRYEDHRSIMLLYQTGEAAVGLFKDASSADYKFDGGPAKSYDMNSYGGEGRGLGAARLGMVLIPLKEFDGRKKLEIRGNGDTEVKAFDLTGLSDLPKAKEVLGCTQ